MKNKIDERMVENEIIIGTFIVGIIIGFLFSSFLNCNYSEKVLIDEPCNCEFTTSFLNMTLIFYTECVKELGVCCYNKTEEYMENDFWTEELKW